MIYMRKKKIKYTRLVIWSMSSSILTQACTDGGSLFENLSQHETSYQQQIPLML